MESILSLVVNAENVRTLVLLVFGFSGFVWLKTSIERKLGGKIDRLDHKIDHVEASLSKRIDHVEASLNKRIDHVEASLNKRIDEVEASLNKRIDEVEDSLNKRIDGVEATLNKRIDGVEASIKELKYNDFAHLYNAIEALTFTLEKNRLLSEEDKAYVDGRLTGNECLSPC